MTMSEGVAVEGGISKGFLLGNESWANLLVNSDNSGGGSEEDKDLGKKDGTEVMGVSPVGQDQAQAQAVGHQPAPENKKWKVGGGGGGKNGMEVEDKGKVTVNGGGGGGESDEHEMHIWTERERRKKMRNMFANLHALLPHLPDKADKSTIVDEAVNYIKVLQQTHQKLQKQKLEMLQGATIVNFDPSLLNQKNVVFESREAFLANHGSSNNLASLISSTSTTPCSGSNLVSNSRFVPANFETLSSPNVVLNMCGEEAQICVCSPKKPGLFANICYILDKYKIGVVSANISSDCNRSMYMIQAHARAAPDLYLDTFPAEEIFKQAAGEISVMASS